jgi:hypothetical protein
MRVVLVGAGAVTASGGCDGGQAPTWSCGDPLNTSARVRRLPGRALRLALCSLAGHGGGSPCDPRPRPTAHPPLETVKAPALQEHHPLAPIVAGRGARCGCSMEVQPAARSFAPRTSTSARGRRASKASTQRRRSPTRSRSCLIPAIRQVVREGSRHEGCALALKPALKLRERGPCGPLSFLFFRFTAVAASVLCFSWRRVRRP